jgi:hypothetical protein
MRLTTINNTVITILILSIGLGVGYHVYLFVVLLYFCTCFKKGITVRNKDILIYLLLFILVIIGFSTNPFIHQIKITKNYFGFFLFYLLFNQNNTPFRINLHKLLLLLSILYIAEAVLINTIVPPNYFPNSPPDFRPGHYTKILGFYQRPFGLWGNPSMSSTIIVSLIAASDKLLVRHKTVKLLAMFAVLLSLSGTGYVLLGAYLFFSAEGKYKILIGSLLAIVYSLLVNLQATQWLVSRITPEQLVLLGQIVLNQFLTVYYVFDQSLSSIVFGKTFLPTESVPFADDIGILPFIMVNGVLGLLIWVLFLTKRINRVNWLPVFILLLGTLHYTALFQVGGQIIFGYILSRSYTKDIFKERTKFIGNNLSLKNLY